MERLGIPTVQILHPVVMKELQNNGFYINILFYYMGNNKYYCYKILIIILVRF